MTEYVPKTAYEDLSTYITDTVETKNIDIGVKIRGFGVKIRDQTEIGHDLGGQSDRHRL